MICVQDQVICGLIDEYLQFQVVCEFEVQVVEEEIMQFFLDFVQCNNFIIDVVIVEFECFGVDVQILCYQIEFEIVWQILVNGCYGFCVWVFNQ